MLYHPPSVTPPFGRCRWVPTVVALFIGLTAFQGSVQAVPSLPSPATGPEAALKDPSDNPDALPQGRRCIEPTDIPDPAHASYIRRNYYNQYGCKIPIRTGRSDFGYNHIVKRGQEQIAAGRVNSHEVTPFAQRLWGAAIGRPGGSLFLNHGWFVASVQYRAGNGEDRIMCVFYDTNDFPYAGNVYKVKGIVTAYWIHGSSDNPGVACREARE